MPGTKRRRAVSASRQSHQVGSRNAPKPAGVRSHVTVPASRETVLRKWLPVILLAALGLAVFANSLQNGFVYDDVSIIRDNPRLTSLWNLKAIFGTSYWDTATDDRSLYRPLTLWSFAVDRALFGAGPFGLHLMNVVANIAVAVLFYLFLFSLVGRADVALLSSCIFVVHPIHTEVVANGVGRAELYCLIALFAACILHLKHIQVWEDAARGENRTRGGLLLFGSMLLYLVALLFKESAVTLPGLLFLAEWLVLQDGKLRAMFQRLWRYFAYAIPLGVFLAMRFSVIGMGSPAAQEVAAGASGPVRMLYASGVLLRYAGQLLFPVWLNAEYSDYNNPVRNATHDPIAIASVFAWIALGWFVHWLARRKEWLPVFGIGWFFLSILPTSNLLFSIGTVRADRLLYLPSAGFCLVAAYYICAIPGRFRRVAIAAAAVWIVALSWRAIVRNAEWKSAETLWPVTVRNNPGSPVGWSFLGDIHRDRGDFTQAEQHYARAIALRAKMGVLYPEATNHRAQMLVKLGRQAEAADLYRTVITKYPKNYVALLNLGEMLLHDPARLDESESLLRRASDVKGSDFRSHANLAQVLLAKKQPATALAAIDRAIALNPAEPLLHEQRAGILQSLGRAEDAQKALTTRDALRRGGNVKLR